LKPAFADNERLRKLRSELKGARPSALKAAGRQAPSARARCESGSFQRGPARSAGDPGVEVELLGLQRDFTRTTHEAARADKVTLTKPGRPRPRIARGARVNSMRGARGFAGPPEPVSAAALHLETWPAGGPGLELDRKGPRRKSSRGQPGQSARKARIWGARRRDSSGRPSSRSRGWGAQMAGSRMILAPHDERTGSSRVPSEVERPPTFSVEHPTYVRWSANVLIQEDPVARPRILYARSALYSACFLFGQRASAERIRRGATWRRGLWFILDRRTRPLREGVKALSSPGR